jgi:NAD(P)-dependent dehydrogenase (short-subunit alcohol dehydrogenase family)
MLNPGTRAVVTGAGSGIGRAFCLELARRGARVLASDIDLASAHQTVALMEGGKSSHHARRCDVSQLGEVEGLAAQADELLGGVDLIINNAGVAVSGEMGQVSMEDWRWVMGINLWGVIHGCHVFVPRLRRQKHGYVLNVASLAGLVSLPPLGPYNVTKAGVVALSETLAAEAAADGLKVSVLCPSFLRTNIGRAGRGVTSPEQTEAVEKLMDASPMNADDVARHALDRMVAGELHIVPQNDAQLVWRLKRLLPGQVTRVLPRLAAWRMARLSRR